MNSKHVFIPTAGSPRSALVLAALAIGLVAVAPASAQGDADLVAEGRRVFQEQGCYGCHTVGKTGTPIAPDLSRVGRKHAPDYFARWLRGPVAQRPSAHMPKIQLAGAEVRALAAYLGSLR